MRTMNYEQIRLEKGMYGVPGHSFTQLLEELDPSGEYAGTEMEGLDAFQRQLKRFDIKVAGMDSDPVQKFFSTTQSAALFPEYVARAVRQGMEEADILGKIVASETKIDSMDYRTITSVPGTDDKSLKPVAEGAAIPETIIKTQDQLVKLHKRGRMLVASYEAIKFQRLDLFTVTLRQIGAYIARAQLEDAVAELMAGTNREIETEEAGGLTYTDLLSLWDSLQPYTMSTMIASPDVMLQMLAVEELKNPQTGLNFQGTGALSTPLGAKLFRSSAVPEGCLIGLDRSCALEKVVASDVAIDSDKLIDRQLERTAITSICGFAKIFPEASKVLRV